MPTYTYPEMPLRGRVWYRAPSIPPPGAADRTDVPLSLSPISPSDFAQGFVDPLHAHPWTHIIRTAPDPEMVDNYLRGDERDLFPITTFEIPEGSGHFYPVIWYHEVGAGFLNHHARVYVARYSSGLLDELPWFQGWI